MNKKTPNRINIFSKTVIVILVIGFLIGNINFGLVAKAFEPDVYKTITEDVERDFTKINRVGEIDNLRTADSKIYLKENGMYETEYFNESVHYKQNGIWNEIDNSLELINNRYYNKANKYNISFPKKISNNKEVILNYLENEIKIYYDLVGESESALNNKIDRSKKNLKDEISYQISKNEIIQYEVKQDSLKENIILRSYIKNYEYSFYIDTTLRIERIGNKIHFYKDNEEVFVMNEYYMYDAKNVISKDIDFEIIVIDKDTYKIEVTPNDNYLKNATYPVVIDPEIRLLDGGLAGGITRVYSIDKLNNTSEFLNIGDFTIGTRSVNTDEDDLIAYIDLHIPRLYDYQINTTITSNQLMYATLTLPTISTNVTYEATVNLNYVTTISWPTEGGLPEYETEYTDSQSYFGSNVFDHKFDILNVVTDNLEKYKTSDIGFGFEIVLDAPQNKEVTYSLGGDLLGPKPVITLGYMSDAGLSDYYTYESLPLSDDSNVYIAHNSGNLTFIYNDYNDGNLLNLSHIYNTNRKNNNSPYGNGFSLSYNEYISSTLFDSKLMLTEGNKKEIIYYATDDSYSQYIAGDGSGDILYRKIDVESNLTGYEIETSDGGLKVYNSEGRLQKIFVDKEDYINGVIASDAKYVSITYNEDGTINEVRDSNQNYITFSYLVNTNNNPTVTQADIPYLSTIKFYKTIPNETEEVQVERIEIIYNAGNIESISKYGMDDYSGDTIFEFDDDKYLRRVHKNNVGYEFSYDIKNRVTHAEVYSTKFENGNYLDFVYDNNGKKTVITNGVGDSTSYTFDDYYHTNSIETSSGYTTFYKYEDIYYNGDGTLITSPNYNKNHKLILQSNSFKNVGNPITNHGFEINTGSTLYGWTKEVTNGSSAKISTDVYLYGSKVLKLEKTEDGNAKVYQEIPVVSGKTYIVTGYIHNPNTTGTGGYITAEAIDGTITTLSNSSSVKNSKNFTRYEYKFTSNYTGNVKVYLVNESVGNAYFDNIQVNTNNLDTRYNYLENSSFEKDTFNKWYSSNQISGWELNGGGTLVENTNLNENSGSKSFNLGTNSYISQSITTSISKGETLVFGGYCFYQNYTGDVSVRVSMTNENGGINKVFTFDENDINGTYMMESLTAEEDYFIVTIEIRNNSNSSNAEIDNFAIYKEGYGVNLSYNDNGDIEEKYNEVTDTTTTYSYDANRNLTKIVTDNDEVNYTYDSNNYLNTLENQNIVTTFKTDNDGNITTISSKANDSTNEYLYSSTTYTSDGLYPRTETNVLDNVTTYTYDYITGFLTSIVDSNNISTEYSYDENGNVIQMINGLGTNKKTVSYTYDVYGKLLTITNGNLVYTLTYNDYGDLKTISVGNSLLLTNNYKNEGSETGVYTGELIESVYSYGSVSVDYNKNHQIEKVYNTSNGIKTLVLEYTYNDYGEIASYKDYKEYVTYYYNYDYQNRLINVNSTAGNNITYAYNENSNLISKTNINGTNEYTYSDYNSNETIENNLISNESISGKFNISYGYSNDSYKQLEIINYYISTVPITGRYTYETVIKNVEENGIVTEKIYYTGRIKELEYTIDENQIIKYEYTYDDYNNITLIKGFTNNIQVYEERNVYNIFNQLIEQEIVIENKNYNNTYQYDSRGNITQHIFEDSSGSSYTRSFSYNNKDEMTQAVINGISYNISYSGVGQPSLYLNYEISYDMRNIVELTYGNYEINYGYNANGIRIAKRVALIVETGYIEDFVNYTLDGNKIIKEETCGDHHYSLEYYYDSNDNVIGFMYNNDKYMYLKNLQNDVIGILDSNNNIVVKYYYDGYGKIIKTIDTSGINLGEINPFRYRSYYQDNETGWYYLNSRYYDPTTSRFITMDQIEYLGYTGSVLGYNLYTYCEGNPVIYVDYVGTIMFQNLLPYTVPLILNNFYMYTATGGQSLGIQASGGGLSKEDIQRRYISSLGNGAEKIETVHPKGYINMPKTGSDYSPSLGDFSNISPFSVGSIEPVEGGYGSYYVGGFSRYDEVKIMRHFLDKFEIL